MAGSGWCHHPLRKTTSELLIMVRRNELACRDEWSHCLWEDGVWSRTADGTVLDAVGAGGPLAPASEDDIAALLRTDLSAEPTDAARTTAEDVVLGEARLVGDRVPAWRRDEPPLPPTRDADSRSAIKRAREAFKERKRIEAQEQAHSVAPADVQPAKLAPVGVAGLEAGAATSENLLAERDPVEHESGAAAMESPVEDELGGAELAAAPDARIERSEVAALGADEAALTGAGPELVEREDVGVQPWALESLSPASTVEVAVPLESGSAAVADNEWREAEDQAVDPDAWNLYAHHVIGDVLPVDAPAFVGASPWAIASAGAEELDDQAAPDGADWWTESETDGGATAGWRAEEELALEDWGGEEDPKQNGGVPEPFGPAATTNNVQEFWATTALDAETVGAEAGIVEAVTAPTAERPGIVLLPTGSVAPGVPRICRTCRDFRPADGGDRGWCANEWAFKTRRLVHPDDTAPCETSIGSWWLPTDELCLTDADVSSHGQPTPSLDHWLPHHREEAPERQQS